MFEKDIAALFGLGGLFMAAVAWLYKRDGDKAKAERDKARVDAKAQGIRAEAKAQEAGHRQEQQKREDATHAADSDSLRDKRDNLFK
jgi:hypothetical protein